jgi:flagellar motor switch protein FliN/FliY
MNEVGNPDSNSPETTPEDLGPSRSLDLLLDVPVAVTVELGRRRMPISELLELSKGSTLELAKAAGELLDVRVNDRLVARGEAVIINDKFGVRLTEIVSRSERVKQLT